MSPALRRSCRALRNGLIWLQCALILLGTPHLATADANDGSTPKAARDSTVTAGQSEGSFSALSDPFTGAAQISYPIEVVPGTNGVQPTVGLSYASGSTAPSWVGKGWSLELGSIQRSLKKGVPNYFAQSFTLNGEELVPDPDDPRPEPVFGATTRFRTRRESFKRIDLVGDGFEVRTTDGMVMRFGTTENSRVRCVPSGPLVIGPCADIANAFGVFPVFAWHLDSIQTPDGNVVQYTYYPQTDAEGDLGRLYPREIRYTLRRDVAGNVTSLNGAVPPQNSVDRVVSFVLEPRQDTRIGFEANFERRMTKRLARIDVSVAGKIVRAYRPRYTQSEDSFATLLTAIEMFGAGGVDVGAPLTTTFAYTGNQPNCQVGTCGSVWVVDGAYFSPVDFVSQDRQDGAVRIADINTDGIDDLVRRRTNFLDPAEDTRANGDYLGTPNAGFSLPGPLKEALIEISTLDRGFSGPVSSADTGTVFADLTGDGIVDQLQLQNRLLDPRFTELFKSLLVRGPQKRQIFLRDPTTPNLLDTVTFALTAFQVSQRIRSGGDIEQKLYLKSVGGGATLAELNGDGFPDLIFSFLADPGTINEVPQTFSFLNRFPTATSGPTIFEPSGFHDACFTLSLPSLASNNFNCAQDGLSLGASATFGGGVSGGEPFGKRYYDVNGDGLDDFQSAYGSAISVNPPMVRDSRITFLNNGTIFQDKLRPEFDLPDMLRFETQTFIVGPVLQRPTLDTGVRLIDVNADGIADLVRATDSTFRREVYLGSQSPSRAWRKLDQNTRLQLPGDMSFVDGSDFDKGIRNLDMNGDGAQDLVRADRGQRQTYRNTVVIPDLLMIATNPMGGTQIFGYGMSARERNGDGSPKNPGLHLNMPVVKTLTVADGTNPPLVTSFEYEGGLFDGADREFRGFRMVRAIRAADGRITETVFHQDLPRAGLVRKTTMKDRDGNLLIETTNAYTDEDAPQPTAPFARLAAGSLVVEAARPGTSLPPRVTATQILYHRDTNNRIQFGRVASMSELGDFNVFSGADVDPSDTRTMELDYTPVDPNAYITSKVSVMRVRAGPPGQGSVVREMRMAYDGAPVGTPTAPLRGLLTTMVTMLNEPGEPNPTTTFTFDEFGNMKTVTSPRANAGQGGGTTMMFVDSTFRTFMDRVVNAAGHETKLTYTPDPQICPNGPPIGTGLLYAEQGPNDTVATRAVRCYDRFGRPTLQRAADNLAETSMSYVDAPGASEISALQRATTSGGVRKTTMFLDGFGRPRRMESDGPGNTTIVKKTSLDAAGRVSEARPAFFKTAPDPAPTVMAYDALDRVVSVTRPGSPVGSPSESGPRMDVSVFDPGVITTTDAKGNSRRTTMDPFDNPVKVEEITAEGTFTTSYRYDSANSLIGVTDQAGNITTIDYDLLGRRKRMVDPDIGTKTFKFDAGGNVKEERGPSGVLTFNYDVLDRLLVRKLDGNDERRVTYDDPAVPNGIGLPATLTDVTSGAGVRSVLAYDAAGRELKVRRAIDGFSFVFQTSFDPLGQIISRFLPNNANYTVFPDARGYPIFITSGSGGDVGTLQIGGIQFDASGRATAYQTANGITVNTSYEADTERLSEIKIQAGTNVLDQRRYAFDLADRLSAIDDVLSSRDQSFGYDGLNRLRQATGPYAAGLAQTTLFYDYTPIGNLLCLDATAAPTPTTCPGGRRLVYPPAGSGTANPRMPPHAPISVNGVAASYTASGNLASLGNRIYRYNALEQLMSVEEMSPSRTLAQYVYSSGGERIRSDDFSGPRKIRQYLLSDDFEFDATRKLARIHIPFGGASVATLTQPYAPTTSPSALPLAAPAPLPAGPFAASAILLLAMLALAIQLGRLHRQGRSLARPTLASGLLLALWIAGVPGSAWALPIDGDLNADGKLDAADALIALQLAQSPPTPPLTPTQMNQIKSGDVAPLEAAPNPAAAVDTADALLILRGAQGDDVDGDGLGSQAELAFRSSPFKKDTDSDGLNDLDESLFGSDPRVFDSDGDGLSDKAERDAGTDPFGTDTDGDGLPDNTDPKPTEGTSFQYVDRIASTILTTGANGTVIQRATYRPFGATVAPASGPTNTPRFGFTGQRFEAGIGLYDYKARFYDPAMGRFLQPDSVVPNPGNPQSLNRYSYVQNTPTNGNDPSGNKGPARPPVQPPPPLVEVPIPVRPGTTIAPPRDWPLIREILGEPKRSGPRPPQQICGPTGCPPERQLPLLPGTDSIFEPALPAQRQSVTVADDDGEGTKQAEPVIFDTQILFNSKLFDKAESTLKSNETPVITKQGSVERDRDRADSGARLTLRGASLPVIPDKFAPEIANWITNLQRILGNKPDDKLGGLQGDGIIGSTSIALQIPLVTQEANFARAVNGINAALGGRPDLVRFIGNPAKLSGPNLTPKDMR